MQRRDAPGLCMKAPSKSEGAGYAGRTLHPRSRVQRLCEETHTSIQVQRRHSGIPCARESRGVKNLDKSTQCRCSVHVCVLIRWSYKLLCKILRCAAPRPIPGGDMPTSCQGFQSRLNTGLARFQLRRLPLIQRYRSSLTGGAHKWRIGRAGFSIRSTAGAG